MLPETVLGDTVQSAGLVASDPLTRIAPFAEQERRIIETAIATFGGNIARAAAALQLNPSTIYRKRQVWVENAPS
jgi:two-component system repressor protein LuxO